MADPTQTLRRELLDDAGEFGDLAAAQAAVDGFRVEYNTRRPHQSLGMAFPADRFVYARDGERLLPLKLPVSLVAGRAGTTLAASSPTATSDPGTVEPVTPEPASSSGPYVGGPVAFERVVPPSGNMQVCGKQFWLGPARSGVTVTFWADTDLVHLLVGGVRVKTVRSHLSVNDLAVLARDGGRPGGPSPLPVDAVGHPSVIEVDRIINRGGTVSLGQHTVLAAEILGGRQVGIRIDAQTLSFFDLDTRELLRTRPNPLSVGEILKLRGARPAGPAPTPRATPIAVQRRASNTGTIMVAWQKVALGRVHAGKTVTIQVSDTQLAIECDDGTRIVKRSNTKAITRIKAHRPRKRTQA